MGFDFAPQSLAGFRIWLKARYGSLRALNREWGTKFTRWSAVAPMTTDAALHRQDEDFSAWADCKEWMDVAFSRAVHAGSHAVHMADRQACAGLEGAQVPGWGGYDYSRLSPAVDVMELYDYGNNVEIARSLAPKLIALTTSSLASQQDLHSVWHELLLGGRGLILWDEANAFVNEDGTPASRGLELRKLATELRSGLAAQLIATKPSVDAVAILYSPASMRTQWLLDRRADGKPWTDRTAETEYEDNSVRAAMRAAAGMLTHLGIQPRWLTDTMIERGALRDGRVRVLFLPHTIALSRLAARNIVQFVRQGGTVLADTEPGQFDSHSRLLVRPLLIALPGLARPAVPMSIWRVARRADAVAPSHIQYVLRDAKIKPGFVLRDPDHKVAADVDIRVFRTGSVRIIGLQADTIENEREVILRFDAPVYVYNLRHPGPSYYGTEIRLMIEPVTPELIAVASAPLAPLQITGPISVRAGSTAEFWITPARAGPMAARLAHIEAMAPNGNVKIALTKNVKVDGRRVVWHMRMSGDAPEGNWTIRFCDVLRGQCVERPLEVRPVTEANRIAECDPNVIHSLCEFRPHNGLRIGQGFLN